MAADYTAYSSILKEVWTSKTLEAQLYQDNPFLATIEKRKPAITIGDTAQTPIHTGRSGGYSAKPRGGGSLNAADEQKVNAASWTWTHHYFQIQIESATIDETSNNSLAAAEVVDVEVSGAVDDMRKQLTRQFVGGNGDSLITACGTTSGSTEIELNAEDGYDALVRGWLGVGSIVDIGTASEVVPSVVSDESVTAVEISATTPSITVASSSTTDSSDYVSIANNRSGTTAYETNGLRNIVSTSETLGGITTTAEPNWVAAKEDSTDQALSLSNIAALQTAVFQKTGKTPDWVLTSPKQQEKFYLLVQPQVRFEGEMKMGAGKTGGVNWNGMQVDAQPDVKDRFWFTLTKDSLFCLRTEGPAWMPQKYGNKGILDWNQGNTSLVSAAVYRTQLAASRRNCNAVMSDLQ
jgi:hypothetical protein